MKRLKKWLLPLFTLLLVAVGAAMPFIASYMQDAQQADPDIRPFDSFSLTLQQQGADLGRILRTIASSAYYINETPMLEDAALTQGLALAAVEDLMTELVKFDLLEREVLAEFSDPRVHPQMVVPVVYSNEEDINWAAAGVPGPDYDPFLGEYTEEDGIPTWTITWNQPDDCHIWLDDASGKAIYIQLPDLSGLGTPDGSAAFGEKVYAAAENWRAFLEDYYSTEVQIAGEDWYDNAVKFNLSFPLGTDEDQEVFQLDLYLYLTYGFSVLSPYVS